MNLEYKTPVLFWNVDTQIDFMKSYGKLYVQDAETIEPVLKELTLFARKHNIKVVNTCDYHNEHSLELSGNPDFIKTFPEHCMQNTTGQEFVNATKPDDAVVFDHSRSYTAEETKQMIADSQNIIIRKDFFDVFFNNTIPEDILKLLAPERIFIYGVATNVCVDFAVTGLAKRGYKVFVIEDAIKALPNIPSPIENWKNQGVTLINSKELSDYL